MTPVLASVQGRVASIVASAVTPASSTPVRCGELLCQKDSYARTLDTVVVSCEPKTAQEAAAKGKKKGGAESAPAEQLWDVVLGNTVIFPEGGGQPSDCGTVGGVPCLRVDNVDGLAKHVLTAPLAKMSGTGVKTRNTLLFGALRWVLCCVLEVGVGVGLVCCAPHA